MFNHKGTFITITKSVQYIHNLILSVIKGTLLLHLNQTIKYPSIIYLTFKNRILYKQSKMVLFST